MPPSAIPLQPFLRRPYICPNCQSRFPKTLRRPKHIPSRLSARSFSNSTSKRTKYAVLSNRRLLRLAGPDASNFLNDLIPAKILGVGTSPIYTAFLTAHGRIINDAFVYPPSWSGAGDKDVETEKQKGKEFEWWIEADEQGLDLLVKHLKKHKLRAKFVMEKVDPKKQRVLYRWPSDGSTQTVERLGVSGPDPRPGMGSRFIIDADRLPEGLLHPEDKEVSLQEYTIHRMLNGLAEGQHEIISGSALPQESNIDIMGGIDFYKGCYVGQELTIRTHHTGVVRKRILPVQVYDASTGAPSDQQGPAYCPQNAPELPLPESNISKASSRRKGRSTGKWLGGVGNIGLALCRLEMMTDVQLTADTTNYDPTEEYKVQWGNGDDGTEVKEVKIKPFVPLWVREGIEASLRRKDKKPTKKREEDDEEEDDEEEDDEEVE